MGIRFLCPNGHKLNVKADLAGKRASCPECGAKLVVPAASAEPVMAAAATIVNPAPAAGAVWYLRTTGGQQLGPATEAQFCDWIAAGRVTGDAHVWRAGWPEWKLARDAGDKLPMPLAAVPIAATLPAAVASIVKPAAPQPVSESTTDEVEFPGPPIVAEVDGAEPIVEDDAAPTAMTYAIRKRQNKKTQITLAIVMLLAVVVLACVLVWVISYNATVEPAVSHFESPTHESERM
jgi:hypothetical protein